MMQEVDAAYGRERNPSADKVTAHEEAAHEKRNWVRLTSYCNNRCTFCLDSAAHNGTFVPRTLIRTQIIDGRRKGATRLILSGGEPTIHPDYVEFIQLGQQLGYPKIQTVTNGRLFSYPDFLNSCLDAGLSEVTFSIHGHNAKVHDALVGVQGAFDEEVEGLKLALADRRPVVNVDVCLNRGNVGHLPELLDRFIGLGVREFDLLHIIPFGRAYEEGRDSLFYDMDEAIPSIRHALALSERPDLHIWFNRFPPPYLEGYEQLIQDPYKLHDEVRGRFGEYDRWIKAGVPLSCRQPDRCERCYMEDICGTLETTLDSLSGDTIDVLRGSAEQPATAEAPGSFTTTWLRAPDVEAATAQAEAAPGRDLVLELDAYDGLPERLDGDLWGDKRVVRAYADRPEDVDHLLELEGAQFEVVAWLTGATAAHLLQRWPTGHARLAVSGRNYERLTEASERDADLVSFFGAWTADCPVEDVPACITGRPPRERPEVLDTAVLNERGVLDIFGFTRRYVLDHYYTKSQRCEACVFNADCKGAHINWIRAHGYKTLQPVLSEASEDSSAAGAP